MAKAATKKPESKAVTLATGTKVSGPAAVVDKLTARAKQDAKPASTK